MKKKFFFILLCSNFLVSSDLSKVEKQEDIIRRHLHQIHLRRTALQREESSSLVEYCKEVVYRASRGGNHLTKKDPLKFDNTLLYEQLCFVQRNGNSDEELAPEMQTDIRSLYNDLQKTK
jgi:hypothetical protein